MVDFLASSNSFYPRWRRRLYKGYIPFQGFFIEEEYVSDGTEKSCQPKNWFHEPHPLFIREDTKLYQPASRFRGLPSRSPARQSPMRNSMPSASGWAVRDSSRFLAVSSAAISLITALTVMSLP